MKCTDCKKRFKEIDYGVCCPHCGTHNHQNMSTDIQETKKKTKKKFGLLRTIILIIILLVIRVGVSFFLEFCSIVIETAQEVSVLLDEDIMDEDITKEIQNVVVEEVVEEVEEISQAVHDENGFLVEDGILTDYIGTNRYITIPEEVIIIAESVFEGNESIETVILNEGLEEIMDKAFYECVYIEKVHFPSTLLKIGAFTFSDCDKLKSADLKEGLLEVGDSAFFSCDELSSITMPKSMKKVHGDAFRVNPWYYDNYPFYGEFIIGDGILNGIYLDSTAKKLVLPSGIKCVASDIIFLSDELEEIIIPEGVHTIMERPLSGFVHEADFIVEIPDSVTQIDGILFLLPYTIENNIKVRCSEGSYAYDYALENGYKIEIK